MQIDDLILVSVDDHTVEPPDLFEHTLPQRYREEAPRIVTKDDGTDVWLFEGAEIPNIALNAVAGRPPEEYGFEPTSFSDIRTGCYDVDDRVRDMSANGMLGALCFPSMTGVCGQLFGRASDKELASALVKAYNDWHIDIWCGAHPDRFIPIAVPAIWDPELAAAEIRRVAAKGCHAVTFSENPHKLGYPSLHSDHWDPFWEACADEGTVVCLHIGSSSQLVVTAPDAPVDVPITLSPINIVQAACDLVFSPVLRKFPTLRVALSEGGIGWIPYFLERIDYVYQHHKAWTFQDFGSRMPSDVFREQIITCFIDDAVGVQLRELVGIEQMTWECDYPHSDSTWPRSPEILYPSLDGLSDAEINAITHENAMRLFQFDPFSIRARERATVGALRAEVGTIDLTTKSGGRRAGGGPRRGTASDIATAQAATQSKR